MKKKLWVMLALAALCFALGLPQVRGALRGTLSAWRAQEKASDAPQEDALPYEAHLGVGTYSDTLDVTLYFRFGQTSTLGAARAQLDLRREETVAHSIVQRLIDGPGIAHDRLSGVFPQGTRLISVTSEGTTAYVTLSRAFLGRPDGAPTDWEEQTAWVAEAAVRRRLAAQSIVLALTEDGRFQRVQLYVADGDDELPQRIPLWWFDPTQIDPTVMLAASGRDESALLTPQRAMRLVLDAWHAKDWAALYPLLARTQAQDIPTLSAFEAQMRELHVTLLSAEVSQGAVSVDGQRATVVVDASLRSADGDAQIVRESVPLTRDADNWAISLAALRALMVRD